MGPSASGECSRGPGAPPTIRPVIRRLPALLLAALASAACGRSAAPPRSVPDGGVLDEALRQRYLRALEEVASGDPVGAAKALGPLLRARPLHVPSHLLHQDLARGEKGLGHLDGEYVSLARELPRSADADVLLVRARAASPEERIAGYQGAAVKDPAAPWPRIALAIARTELARELLRRASAKERDGFAEEAKRLRAEARASADRARTEAERAVALAPALSPAHGALGHALAAAVELAPPEGDKERREVRGRALDVLGKALSLDPGDPALLLDRALVLRDAGDMEGAARDLETAAAAAPRDPRILAARARNLSDLRRLQEATDAWREAVDAAPGDPDLRVDLGTALAASDRWPQALAEFRLADRLYATAKGERWKARRGLVTALVQMGFDEQDPARLAEAREHLRAYREEGGPDAGWAAKEAEFLGEGPAGPPE